MPKVYTRSEDIDFTLDDIKSMPLPQKVMMVEPSFFSVDYVINPHMKDHIGKVDKEKALLEWSNIKSEYEKLGLTVHQVEGQKGLPDMVFCANQSLPYFDENNNKEVLMSIMHSDKRSDEVAFIEDWFKHQDYKIHHLDHSKYANFEGMGDAIWINGKRLICGGYGFRSSKEVYEHISELFDIPVLAFELVSDSFYHLDTCFCSLNESTVLIYPDAFTETGLNIIRSVFPTVIEAPKYEAEELFACNATCPDGKNVIIQKGCATTKSNLEQQGFHVIEVETEEYLKSGGSVFCMKLMHW